MKTAKLLSVLILSSTLLTTACTPKDEAITDKATRDRILEQKNRRGGRQGKPGQAGFKFQFGNYASTVFLLGKVTESAEVLRLALNGGDANKSVYKKSGYIKSEDGRSSAVTLNAEKVTTAYSTTRGDFSTTLTKKWDIEIASEDDKVMGLKAVAKKTRTSLDQKNLEKTFVNLNEDEVVIEVTPKSEGILAVKITGSGVVNGRLKNAATRESFKFEAKYTASLEQLLEGKVDIADLDSKLVYLKEGGKEWNTYLKGDKGFSLELEGLCNTINLTAKIGSTKNPKILKSDKDSIEVEGSNFKSSHAPCGSRPTHDLSFMLM